MKIFEIDYNGKTVELKGTHKVIQKLESVSNTGIFKLLVDIETRGLKTEEVYAILATFIDDTEENIYDYIMNNLVTLHGLCYEVLVSAFAQITPSSEEETSKKK